MTLKQVCAWCGKVINLGDDPNPDPARVSHGICDGCLKKQMDKMDKGGKK